MNLPRAVSVVVGSIVVGALAGAGVGFVLGKFLPDYYRNLLVHGREPGFDPLAVGIGQGLTQGLVGGALIGVVLVAILAWHDVRRGAR